MSKFQFPTFSNIHCKRGEERETISQSVRQGCGVVLYGRRASYSGLSSVVFVQDVEWDLVGDAPQQAGRVQVPLEAEQPVDPALGGRGARGRGAAAQPRCHKGIDTRRDIRNEQRWFTVMFALQAR